MKIHWRGRHLSPLLTIGKYTSWFTNSIAFGYDNAVRLTIYAGWLIVSVKVHYRRDIRELSKHNFKHIWIIKYGK